MAISRLSPLRGGKGDATWLLIVRAARMATQFVVVVVLARSHGPHWAGAMALALAVCAPVFILSDLGLRTITLTMRPAVGFSRLLRVRLIATSAALAVCGLLTQIPGVFGNLILIIAVAKTADAFVELALAPAQLDNSLRRIAILTASTYVFSSTAVAFLVTRTSPDLALWIGLAIPTSAMGIGALLLGRASAQRVDPPSGQNVSTTRILRAGGAVGIATGILSLTAGIPQYMISGFISTIESGRYAVILYVVLGVELVLNALVQAWLPAGVRIRAQGGEVDLRRFVSLAMFRASIASIPLSIVLVGLAWLVLPITVGPQYRIGGAEMIALAILLVCEPALFLGSAALQVMNLYSIALFTSVAAALAVVVVSFLVVPVWGVTGGLIATITGVLARIFVTQRAFVRASGAPKSIEV